VEPLELREVPATYYWVGSTDDNKWSNTEDWRLDKADPASGQKPNTAPGSGDDVVFDASADKDKVRPDSVMDVATSVASLDIQDRSAKPYSLTLMAALTIKGPTESTIAGGTVTGGSIEFNPAAASDGPTFTWEGGTLDSPVTVSKDTKLRIASPKSKVLKQKLQINSLDATWDGQSYLDPTKGGIFLLTGSNAELAVGTGLRSQSTPLRPSPTRP
jgi:hypothetical protein